MRVLANQVISLHGVFDGREKFFAQPRLDDEAVNFAFIDGLDDGIEIEHRGDENARRVGLDFARLSEQFQAGQTGHALVGNDGGEFAILDFLDGFERIGNGQDVEIGATQGFLERSKNNVLIVDNQNRRRGFVRCKLAGKFHALSSVALRREINSPGDVCKGITTSTLRRKSASISSWLQPSKQMVLTGATSLNTRSQSETGSRNSFVQINNKAENWKDGELRISSASVSELVGAM